MMEKLMSVSDIKKHEGWPTFEKAIQKMMRVSQMENPGAKIELVEHEYKWHITADGVPDYEIDAIDLKEQMGQA